MSRSSLLTALLVVAFTAPAQADLWKRASEPADPTVDVYNALMQKGDDAAIAANSQSMSLATVMKQLDTAIESYRAAAKIRPKAAEPFFRIGSVLNSFFFDDCDKTSFRQAPPPMTCFAQINLMAKAREMVEAWDAFEALSPLDPRINELLVTRAITRTKLVATTPKPQPLLEAAAKDYQALLDRADGVLNTLYGQNLGQVLVLGNLAETYMMLGDIEKAIYVYSRAKDAGARSSTLFGLAVALDRDDRGGDAAVVIRSLGMESYEGFHDEFTSGKVFFVPAGEEQYYFALANEAFGNSAQAIEHWRQYIRSGAHPQFQPRAKEHLDKLLRKNVNVRIESPITPDFGREPLMPKSPFDPVSPPPPRPPRKSRP